MATNRDENNNERSALESIEHELYDPKVKVNATEVHQARPRRSLDLPTSWGEDSPIIVKGEEEKGFSFGTKFLLVATVLLLCALAFSAWRILSLRNVVSSENIDMTADVTPYVEGGEATALVLTLRNRNTAILDNANVTLLYKQGNGSEDEQEKIQERREIGSIKSGEFKKQDFSIMLYGSENESRDITLKLEYKVPGSNALFSKVITNQVILKTPQISVRVGGPDTLSVGQNGLYSFTVTNNSATSSLASILKLTLPNSFTVESASPLPIPRTTSWRIAPLAPGASTTITLAGSFDGKQGEVATIQAKIGSLGDSPSTIGVVYSSETRDVTLRTSPLTLSMTLSSDNSIGEVLRYNDQARLTLTYNNTSQQALTDVVLKLNLSGDAALYNSINPLQGYYDSIAKTVTWDKATFPDLAVLAPGAQGTLQVTIPIVSKGNNSPTLKVGYVGTASTKNSEDVVATINKTYAVQGSAALIASTQYKTSSFPNSGPVPPEPNKETTYTVNLKLVAQNPLNSAKISFVLPAYVSWRNVTSDPSATYSATTRTVTWNVGQLEQGKFAAVEIGLAVKPSQSHVGGSPSITSGIVLDAVEEVSRAHLKTTLSPLTTSVYAESWPQNPAIVVSP